MKDNYYDPKGLKNFSKIKDFQEPLGSKFFEYYNAVFKEGGLTKREKCLIALAVSYATQCPYRIDAYTVNCLENSTDKTQMMEAVHVGAAINSGATLVHSV